MQNVNRSILVIFIAEQSKCGTYKKSFVHWKELLKHHCAIDVSLEHNIIKTKENKKFINDKGKCEKQEQKFLQISRQYNRMNFSVKMKY